MGRRTTLGIILRVILITCLLFRIKCTGPASVPTLLLLLFFRILEERHD
jgi:hypothetical protein